MPTAVFPARQGVLPGMIDVLSSGWFSGDAVGGAGRHIWLAKAQCSTSPPMLLAAPRLPFVLADGEWTTAGSRRWTSWTWLGRRSGRPRLAASGLQDAPSPKLLGAIKGSMTTDRGLPRNALQLFLSHVAMVAQVRADRTRSRPSKSCVLTRSTIQFESGGAFLR